METEINKNTNAYVYEKLFAVNGKKCNVIMNVGMFEDLNKNLNPYKRLEGFIDNELMADYFGISVDEFNDMIVTTDYYPQNYECWYIKLIDGEKFEYNNDTYYNGDFIFYYNGEWINIPNVDMYNVDDLARHKYLSALTNRFLPSYLINNFPNFVQFIREYLKICDNGWYKIICNISDYGNIDKMPNDVLLLAVSQYAISFTSNLKNIRYFYNENTKQYRYDNIRNFLRISRKYLSCKGTAQSIFFLYDMIFYNKSDISETNVEIVLPYERILKISDYNAILNESEVGKPQSGNYSEETASDQSEIIYIYPSTISGKDDVVYYTYPYGTKKFINEEGEEETEPIMHHYDNLSHLHGTDEDDIDDMNESMTYGYFTVMLHHNLNNPKEFAEMFEELVKPTGIKMVWKKMNSPKSPKNRNGYFEIYNEDKDLSIYPYNIFVSADDSFCSNESISFRLMNINKNGVAVLDTSDKAFAYMKNSSVIESCECEYCLSKMMNEFNSKGIKRVDSCPYIENNSACPLLTLDTNESITIEYKVDGKINDTLLKVQTKSFDELNSHFPFNNYMEILIEGNVSN